MSIPRIDPTVEHGAVTAAWMSFGRSKVGRWTGINVATRIDPFLMRVSRGRVSVAFVLPVAMMTTTGARSGQPRENPVLYFSDGDDVILIASSFGREHNPAWYHNIVANPEVTLRVGRAEGRYRGRELDGGERERVWALAVRVYPGYEDYRLRAAPRRIPVLALAPM